MKNSAAIVEQYKAQMLAGVIPTREEILQNPALSMADKQKILGTANSSGRKEPTSTYI